MCSALQGPNEMPLSIYQIQLGGGFLQATFHPRNSALFTLYESGELLCISPEGQEGWRISLPCAPILFRINTTGDRLTVLGKGALVYCDLLTRETSNFKVHEGLQLLDVYKNSAVVGGFQKDIILIKPNGSTLKTISFAHLVRQFKVSSRANSLLVYDNERNLVCTDMGGNAIWRLENLVVHDEILVSQEGHAGYFVIDPHDLIQFDVRGESFLEVDNERPLKSFSISADGKALLTLDIDNTLRMRDENAKVIWDYNPDHTIREIGISPKGNLFLAIDNDNVLSCYATDPTKKARGEFFELREDKRIVDKEATWTKRPGADHPIGQMGQLSVNAAGNGLGLKGLDGRIHFYDEKGEYHYATAFPAMLEAIAMSDSFHYGSVCGENELIIVDFQKDEKNYMLFDKPFLGKPVINYHQKNIFLITKEKELHIYDFKGRLLRAVSFEPDYQKGISCESHGIILLEDKSLTGISEQGKVRFKCPLGDRILSTVCTGDAVVCVTKGRSLFSFDLSNQRGKKRTFQKTSGDIRIVSANPLLIVVGKEKLYHLDEALSLMATHEIKSPDSHFFLEGNDFYEIVKRQNRFYCYDENGSMAWRFDTREGIRESAITGHGLVVLTLESIQYTAIKGKVASGGHFSEFLEF